MYEIEFRDEIKLSPKSNAQKNITEYLKTLNFFIKII